VRDWANNHEQAFGLAGGNLLIKKRLTEKKNKKELQNVREAVQSCFDTIEGFNMPSPGKNKKQSLLKIANLKNLT
jgi:hypothetical protein